MKKTNKKYKAKNMTKKINKKIKTQKNKNYSKVKFINEIFYCYNFYGNKSKPRDISTEDAQLAIKYSRLIRNRGYIK